VRGASDAFDAATHWPGSVIEPVDVTPEGKTMALDDPGRLAATSGEVSAERNRA